MHNTQFWNAKPKMFMGTKDDRRITTFCNIYSWATWSPRFSHCGGHSSTFSLGFFDACLWNMLCCGWTECGHCTGALFCFCTLDGDETSSQKMLAAAFTVEIRGNYTPTYIHTYTLFFSGPEHAMQVNHSITVAHHSICVTSVEVDTVHRNIFAGSQALGH